MSMRPIELARMCWIAGVACSAIALVGCGGVDPRAGSAVEPDSVDDVLGTDPVAEVPGDDPQSVDDVTPDDGSGPENDGENAVPDVRVSVVVRNPNEAAVDVVALFTRGGITVNVSFVTVQPESESVIHGPGESDEITLRGVSDGSLSFSPVTLARGIDFDLERPALFVIELVEGDGGDSGVDEPDPFGGSGSSPDPDHESDVPPSIELLEPARDVTLPLGSPLVVRWTDFSPTPANIVISFVAVEGDRKAFAVSSPLAERGDGLNDQTEILVQGVPPGEYLVIAEIANENRAAQSVAPGRILVVMDELNDAPIIRIVQPTEPSRHAVPSALFVAWEDSDDDDNASIRFRLEQTRLGGDRLVYEFPTIYWEDPDDPSSESAELALLGALPGVYDLVAHISDGELSGTSRVQGAVEILAEPLNDLPSLSIVEPSGTIETRRGESLMLSWTDADRNDNAVITLMLDPDLQGGDLDGDEVVVASSIPEDPDGPGDRFALTIPNHLSPGQYRAAGRITDGAATAISFAPGLVRIGVIPGAPGPTPSLSIERLAPPLALRAGDVFHLDIVVANAPAGDLMVTMANDRSRIAVYAARIPADVHDVVSVEVDTAVLGLPNDHPVRWFDVEASLTDDTGLIATAFVAAGVWIRQELRILHVDHAGMGCDEPRGPNEPPLERSLTIEWYGGGFLTGGSVMAPVAFWLVRDGDGFRGDPLGAEGLHYLLHETVESPGVVQQTAIQPSRLVGIPDGTYAVVAVVEHPDFGRLVEVYPNLIEVCTDGAFGAIGVLP
ncbi:MAG: hypothetical protein C4547_08575 [Phycisphaerales bacterium]|nr:MAG: hypothetical protein C4547_08575 [Phycisphaerales bacterium]